MSFLACLVKSFQNFPGNEGNFEALLDDSRTERSQGVGFYHFEFLQMEFDVVGSAVVVVATAVVEIEIAVQFEAAMMMAHLPHCKVVLGFDRNLGMGHVRGVPKEHCSAD